LGKERFNVVTFFQQSFETFRWADCGACKVKEDNGHHLLWAKGLFQVKFASAGKTHQF
jgi:hypothetical protein